MVQDEQFLPFFQSEAVDKLVCRFPGQGGLDGIGQEIVQDQLYFFAVVRKLHNGIIITKIHVDVLLSCQQPKSRSCLLLVAGYSPFIIMY